MGSESASRGWPRRVGAAGAILLALSISAPAAAQEARLLTLWPADTVDGADDTPQASDQESIPRLHPETPSGIDPDGRIPKVPFPDDLEHPDRWRYIPEGLMPEGNILERFLRTTFITPILFFEGDVGTGGGLSLADVDFRDSRRQEFLNLWISYTTEGQQQYLLTWRRWFHQRELESGGVIQEERSTITTSVGYTRTLTRRFYGFGADSDDNAETSYSESLTHVQIDHQLTFPHPGDDWVFSWGARLERRNLGEGEVSGVPNTEDAFPTTFDEGDSYDSLWLEAGMRYDTRDSQHLPYSGGSIGAGVTYLPFQSDSNHGAIFGVSGTNVWPLPPLFHSGPQGEEEHPPIDTAAVAFQVREAEGDLPFWILPSLGGSYTLRGYGPNRFTDEASVHASAEYRFWLVPRGVGLPGQVRIERIGAALFFDAGTVAESAVDLPDEDLLWSAGVGIRMTFDRQALFRIDYGWSDEGSNLSINYGLSF